MINDCGMRKKDKDEERQFSEAAELKRWWRLETQTGWPDIWRGKIENLSEGDIKQMTESKVDI